MQDFTNYHEVREWISYYQAGKQFLEAIDSVVHLDDHQGSFWKCSDEYGRDVDLVVVGTEKIVFGKFFLNNTNHENSVIEVSAFSLSKLQLKQFYTGVNQGVLSKHRIDLKLDGGATYSLYSDNYNSPEKYFFDSVLAILKA